MGERKEKINRRRKRNELWTRQGDEKRAMGEERGGRGREGESSSHQGRAGQELAKARVREMIR